MTAETRDALDRYRNRMWELMQVTIRNDRLIAEMGARAASLVELTDKARERQHASNADIIASLTEGDRKLRLARDIVDRAYELQAANAHHRPRGGAARGRRACRRAIRVRQRNCLSNTPGCAIRATISPSFCATTGNRVGGRTHHADALLRRSGTAPEAGRPAGGRTSPQAKLADWVERLLKVHSTEQRALHDEVAELLTYSVQRRRDRAGDAEHRDRRR